MTPALTLYLLAAARAEALLSRRPKSPPADVVRVPPVGDVVWIHLGSGERPESAVCLAARIADDWPEAGFVVTSDAQTGGGGKLAWLSRPNDFPKAVGSFLSDWRPSAGVWIGGPVWPVLASKARQSGVPLQLVNATDALAKGHRGVPARDLLGLFDGIEACGDTDRRALERAARRPVSTIGRLQRSTRPLENDESERHRLAATLHSRPVWLAAGATESEADALQTAHAIGQSASHRLLLIIQPADASAASVYLERYRVHRSDGRTPPPSAGVYVADVPGEEGLWYRLASVSFIGGSLDGPLATADPFAAAALGSAVLHGPMHAPYAAHFAELAGARASRPVRDAQTLGRAVEDLLAPDRTAELAHRAWTVVSEGAQATDHVAETVGRVLDARP